MLISKSPNKGFYIALGLVIGGLGVAILILALLVSTSGPRVRHVAVQNQANDGAASVGQGLTIVFDRPIEKTDFESAIEFEPAVDYTVSHRNQQLSITFDQNLLSNTEYVLTIKPELQDTLGKQMDREYSYRFTTAEPSYTYLERNYGRGEVDKIIQRAPLSQESYVLFGADRIKHFARGDGRLAVVLPRADATDELRVVDLRTREEKTVDIPPNVQIDNLRYSPVDNQLVFITRAVYKPDISETDQETYNNKLYRYDVDGEQLQPVDTLSDEGDVESVLYSRDGQALLYRTRTGTYYLTGATRTTEPTLIGIYGDTGGFDRTNTKLAFQSLGGVAIYDAQARELQELPNLGSGGSISPPKFLHNSDELIYLWDPYNEKEGKATQIYIANPDGKVEEQVVSSQPPERFFENPVVSYDDRYVLIRTTSKPHELDDYVGNRRPKDARFVLYDRFDHKVAESDTRGVDPVWNR